MRTAKLPEMKILEGKRKGDAAGVHVSPRANVSVER